MFFSSSLRSIGAPRPIQRRCRPLSSVDPNNDEICTVYLYEAEGNNHLNDLPGVTERLMDRACKYQNAFVFSDLRGAMNTERHRAVFAPLSSSCRPDPGMPRPEKQQGARGKRRVTDRSGPSHKLRDSECQGSFKMQVSFSWLSRVRSMCI